jgi:hypothetical protein
MKSAICRQTQLIYMNDREQEVPFIPEFQSYDIVQVEDAKETLKNQKVILTLIHDPRIDEAQKVSDAEALKAENEKLKAEKEAEAAKQASDAEALKAENEKLKAELAAAKKANAKKSDKGSETSGESAAQGSNENAQ